MLPCLWGAISDSPSKEGAADERKEAKNPSSGEEFSSGDAGVSHTLRFQASTKYRHTAAKASVGYASVNLGDATDGVECGR